MKIFFILLLSSILLLSKEITIEELQNIKTIKKFGIEVKEFEDLSSIYLVRGLKNTKKGQRVLLFSVTKDLKYTFLGRGFDNQTGSQLYIKKSLLPYKKEASLTYGNGKEEYFIFTDPECPYCKKLEKQLASIKANENIKIYYYLYPLPFHKEAIPMSKYIYTQSSNTSKIDAMHKIMINNSQIYKNHSFSKQENQSYENHLLSIKKITKDLAVSGTPSIFKADGTKVNPKMFLKEYSGR